MKKIKLDVYAVLKKVRLKQPVVHHLTNWVTIYECANIVKAIGGSPVMAHAREEVAQMAGIADALVLNIGTLTKDLVESMKIAGKSANKKGIPVILDACGAGATALRTNSCLDLIDNCRIDILKGNASEIACIAGEKVKTKGVDSTEVKADLKEVASRLAKRLKCVTVITAKEDIISDGNKTYLVGNGDPMMGRIVGTGCMAASVIGTFAAVEKDLSRAAACGLACFEIAAELAVKKSNGPGTFKERLYDCIYNLDEKTLNMAQKVYQ